MKKFGKKDVFLGFLHIVNLLLTTGVLIYYILAKWEFRETDGVFTNKVIIPTIISIFMIPFVYILIIFIVVQRTSKLTGARERDEQIFRLRKPFFYILSITMIVADFISLFLENSGEDLWSFTIFEIYSTENTPTFEFLPNLVDNNIFSTVLFTSTFILIIIILTIFIKITRELSEANEKLKEFDQLKRVFIRNMSHELRTPLTSIIGFTRMLLKKWAGDINEEQENQLTIILGSANKLLDLINEIIDVSKIEADKLDIKKEEYDLIDELKILKKMLVLDVEKKGLKFLMNIPDSLLIFNDKRRINQILQNLIVNAIKFTDKGRVSLTIQKLNGVIMISVEDTGQGIKEENLEKLFKPFSRIIEIDHFKEGTGLGLHLSQKLAHSLGGDISVESEWGTGSTFTFTLEQKLEEEEISI